MLSHQLGQRKVNRVNLLPVRELRLRQVSLVSKLILPILRQLFPRFAFDKKKRALILIKLPYSPELLLLGIDQKEPKTDDQTTMCTQMFITAVFTRARMWK